ncbi:MAG: metallophosphoesterase [Deltaproteobacteria bacterium]|nr:metallophosphoesterase [Deltaproteobacteria bacterium]
MTTLPPEAPSTTETPSADKDRRRLLIVSDMHLGRDCNYITGFKHRTRPNPEFDQAFIDMLDYYTVGQEQSWRIIFGGDFIDFIEVVVVPGSDSRLHLSFDVTDEEKEFGLGTEAERVCVKLEETLDYHEAFFRRVARFVAAGGEIVVLRGNHDVELHWKKVQRVFRQRLSSLAYEGLDLGIDEVIDIRNEFQTRISFAPWIYYEATRIYVEHGHQYDAYCSFDSQLYPLSPTNQRRIDTPLAAFAMRYFVNLLTDFKAHNADVWGTRDYIAWLRARGFAGAFYVARMGLSTGVRTLSYAVQMALGFRVRRYREEHEKLLVEEAARLDIPPDKLLTVDMLRHMPVNRNLPELIRLLFLDRILLVAGALLLTFLILLVFDSTWPQLIGVVLTAILALRINSKMAPRRFLLPGPKQAQAAARISEILNVPSIVMGHSHVRRVSELGDGKRYINSGCWLPPLPGQDHVDAAAPCSCRFAHVVVESDGQADLRIFCRATRSVRVSDVKTTDVWMGERDDEQGVRTAPAPALTSQ